MTSKPGNTVQNSQTIIHSPAGIRLHGLGAWKWMIADLWRYRELLERMIHRELAVRYRQSLLGYVWALILPLVSVSIFAFLAHSRILNIGATSLPYVLFALSNLCLWHLFSGILVASANSLSSAEPMIRRTGFPREILVLAAISRPIMELLIRLPLLILLFAGYGILPPLAALCLPVLLLPLVALGTGLGLILAATNLAIRDISQALTVFLSFAMFLAPVVYPIPVNPYMWLVYLNPVTPFLEMLQDMLSTGMIEEPGHYIAACLFSFSVLLVAWRWFHLVIHRIIPLA